MVVFLLFRYCCSACHLLHCFYICCCDRIVGICLLLLVGKWKYNLLLLSGRVYYVVVICNWKILTILHFHSRFFLGNDTKEGLGIDYINDFVCSVIFVFESNEVDPLSVQVCVFGSIKNDKITLLIKRKCIYFWSV